MGGSTISQSETRIESLKLQSSAYGVTVPLNYGLTRVPGNLLWYGGFKGTPHTSSGDGGGKGGIKTENTTYSYSANLIVSLGHGQITGIPRVWKGKQVYTGGYTPAQIVTVTQSYAFNGPASITVGQAAAFAATVSVVAQLGSSADNSSTVSLAEGTDYTRSGGTYNVTIDFGQPATLGITYQFTTTALTQSALQQLDLSFISGAIGQSPWAPLPTLAPGQALGYSGQALVAGQDYDLSSGGQIENHLFEVQAALAYSVGSSTPDADPADIVTDVLVNARYGAAFPALRLGDTTAWANNNRASNLLCSPSLTEQARAADLVTMACRLTNTAPVWSGSKLTFLPYGDQVVAGNGRTFTPDVTPIYDLTDDHFLDQDDPVDVQSVAPSERFNHVRVEYRNRGVFDSGTQQFTGQYSNDIAEAKDQADIDQNGLRSAQVEQMHWVCDGDVARHVAQLILQRSLYITNKYTFRLGPHFALVGPMSLLTLTDSVCQLDRTPVRVIEREEDEDGELKFTCEDFPIGVASATLYPNQKGAGFSHDYNVSPGNAQPPVIFESPGALTTTGLELCVASAGLGANWGGAQVWASYDGNTYERLGTLVGPSRYGALAAGISGDFVDVTIKTGQLLSGSAADLAALATLCYIGGSNPEFVAYQTATLTGALAYRLSTLTRGAYGTATNAHAAADTFVRLDSAVTRSGPLDPALIGKTIYIKLCSYNVYGGAQQSLADVSATSYVISGAFQTSRGGIRTFRQNSAPVSPRDGDLWIQPASNKQFRWNAATSTWEIAATNGADWTTNLTGKPSLFRVVTRGQLDTQGPALAGLYVGDAATGVVVSGVGGTRSYVVHVIRRSDGVVLSSTVYDVFVDPANANALAAQLNGLGTDVIVVVRGEHEPQSNRTTTAMLAAMLRCGASQAVFGSPQFKFRSAFVLVGIPGSGEGNGYEAYSGSVDNDTNAWCDVGFTLQGGNLLITGSGATPRTLADYSYTGSLNATTDLVLIGRGVTVTGNVCTKPATAATAWDADAYSADAYVGGSYASAVAVSTSKDLMFGLNSDPAADSSYSSLDYAWRLGATGQLEVWESNAGVASLGAYAVGDVFAVTYDGARVQYLQNGVVKRTVAAAAGLRLFWDSSFSTPGGSLTGVRFGPMSAVTGIDTAQLAPGAATEIRPDYLGSSAGAVIKSNGGVVDSDTFTPTYSCNVLISINFDAQTNNTGWDGQFGCAARIDDISAGTSVASFNQGLGSVRSNYSVKLSSTMTAGRQYRVALVNVNNPSNFGSGQQYWNVRIHVELIKR